MNKDVYEILNEQVNREFFSAYLYLSMSAYFADLGLAGFANWMKIQAQEEQAHGMLIYDFIIDRGEKVVLKNIEKPQAEWECPLCTMEEVLKHEKYITESINNIMTVAEQNKDRATMSYMNWFIDEQVEEEATAQDIIAKLKLIGEDKSALFMMDKELSTRTFTPPSIAGE